MIQELRELRPGGVLVAQQLACMMLMLLASDRLTNSSDSISVIALSLGYKSESTFSKTFKRVMLLAAGL